MVGIAQQGNAVRARHAGASAVHDFFHHPAAHAFGIVRLGRCIGLGHQHVAVGQHVEPARMIQAFGERGHLGTGGGDGLGAFGPADGRGDIDGGDQRLVRLRQPGRGPGAVGDLQGRAFAARSEATGEHDQ